MRLFFEFGTVNYIRFVHAIWLWRVSVLVRCRVDIDRYAFWNRDCSLKHFQVKIEKAPLDGEVDIVEGTKKIPENPSIGIPLRVAVNEWSLK